MRVGILGSCISRDIFRVKKLDHLIRVYRARTSIHSLTQDDIADITRINLPTSNFQSKMVKDDFEKTELNLVDCDFLLLDLIDERFQLITNYGSVVTLSNELKNSNTIEQADYYVKRGTEQDYVLWRNAIKKFSKMIDIPIILHKSRLSNKLNINKEGINIDFQYIKKMNHRLIQYEKIIYEELDIIGTVDVDERLLISDINHIWGYSPYHYIDQYYEEAMEQIYKITNTNKQLNLEKSKFRIHTEVTEGRFIIEVIGDTTDLNFAFYIFSDDEIIHKEWYSTNTKFLYDNSHPENSLLSVRVFIKNSYNQIITIDSINRNSVNLKKRK